MRALMPSAVSLCLASTAAAANACLDDTSLATVERAACLESQAQALEAQMVDAYLAVKANSENADPPWDTRLNQTLQASQVDFENYRDSQCDFESTQMQGGTALGIVNFACRNALTRDRISLLTSLAGGN